MPKTKKPSKPKAQPKRQNRSVAVRAPTSLSVRHTTQNSGNRQSIQLFDVVQGLNQFTILPASLPWLAGVAPSYQTWRLDNVEIWYEPRVSTATNGVVAMTFQRDFMDGIPQTLSSLTLSQGAKRAAVWDRCHLQVPSGPAREYCSLSNFNASSPTDKNQRALGRVFVWSDTDEKIVAGRVYMSYTPHLVGPVDPTTQG